MGVLAWQLAVGASALSIVEARRPNTEVSQVLLGQPASIRGLASSPLRRGLLQGNYIS